MSLGARPRDVMQMLVKEALLLIIGGVIVGLAGASVFGRLLGHELADIGIRYYDPLTFACVSLLLIAAALLACYLPTRRAMKVDPIVALRYE